VRNTGCHVPGFAELAVDLLTQAVVLRMLPVLLLHLLQHLAGGCVLGAAAEDGSAGPATVGLVKGTANVVVSDLSAVPLPRVSPQMTAYLLGYHIATQRYGQQEAPAVAEKAQLAAGTAAGTASSAA
jgi:hypothetical protein